jgi:hypothetical protein
VDRPNTFRICKRLMSEPSSMPATLSVRTHPRTRTIPSSTLSTDMTDAVRWHAVGERSGQCDRAHRAGVGSTPADLPSRVRGRRRLTRAHARGACGGVHGSRPHVPPGAGAGLHLQPTRHDVSTRGPAARAPAQALLEHAILFLEVVDHIQRMAVDQPSEHHQQHVKRLKQ